jgi:hypothetical protein
VKPCRLRYQTCETHLVSLKKSPKCQLKLHFYIPLDAEDHRRLFILCGEHNHELIENEVKATTEKSESILVPLVNENAKMIEKSTDSFGSVIPTFLTNLAKFDTLSPVSFSMSPNLSTPDALMGAMTQQPNAFSSFFETSPNPSIFFGLSPFSPLNAIGVQSNQENSKKRKFLEISEVLCENSNSSPNQDKLPPILQ